MSDHVYWTLEFEIQPGQKDNFKSLMTDLVTSTRAERGTLNYEWHLTSDGKVCHTYERFTDAAAAMAHLGNFGPFASRFLEVANVRRLLVFGSPSGEVREALAAFNPTYLEPAEWVTR